MNLARASSLLVALPLALMIAGCTATPPVTPTAPPVATPSPTPAPPTPTPAPDPLAAAWAAEICDINADFSADGQAVFREIPDPTDPTLDERQGVIRERHPRLVAIVMEALERLDALEPIDGGRPFQEAVEREFRERLVILDTFLESVDAAVSLDSVGVALAAQNDSAQQALLRTMRSVNDVSQAAADAIADVQTGCRSFDYDARGRPRERPSVDFADSAVSTVVDDFTTAGAWPTGPFVFGEVEHTEDGLEIDFEVNNAWHGVTTEQHEPAVLGDVRVRATFAIGSFALSGLTCRDTGDRRYTAQVNNLGLVLIYRWGPQQTILGRHARPEGAFTPERIDLALECVGGRDGEPVLLIAYLDGERVVEVVDDEPLTAEGTVGMFAQSVNGASTTIYRQITVLWTPD